MTNFTACCSTKQFFSRSLKLTFILSLFFLSFSCRKNNDFYLNGGLPGGNLDVVVTDTVSFRMITERRPSVQTNQLDTLLAGSVSDPVFGRTTATIYSQLLLSTFSRPVINSTTVIDSTILTLSINTRSDAVTGYAADVQTWRIFPLTQSLEQNMTYFSDTSIQYGSELGSYKGNFAGRQTIRIALNGDLAKKYFQTAAARLVRMPHLQIW
jgi:hypothetical protein